MIRFWKAKGKGQDRSLPGESCLAAYPDAKSSRIHSVVYRSREGQGLKEVRGGGGGGGGVSSFRATNDSP